MERRPWPRARIHWCKIIMFFALAEGVDSWSAKAGHGRPRPAMGAHFRACRQGGLRKACARILLDRILFRYIIVIQYGKDEDEDANNRN